MGDHQRAIIPPEYSHKATSESFTGASKVSIYVAPNYDRKYLVVIHTALNEDSVERSVYLNKQELDLFIQSANDVISDERVW